MPLDPQFWAKCPVKVAIYHENGSPANHSIVVFPWKSEIQRRNNFTKVRLQLANYRGAQIKVAQFFDRETNTLIGEFRRDIRTGEYRFSGNIF